MKTLLMVLLAAAGILCLALGTTAWAQSGYSCYDCTYLCGPYPCYSAVASCAYGNGQSVSYDQTLLGSCTAGNTVDCNMALYVCKNSVWTYQHCESNMCNPYTSYYSCQTCTVVGGGG